MIEILISSTALILIICGIRTFWKGKINSHLQYALWLLVVIRLLPFSLFMDTTIPKIESPISIMRSFNHLYNNLSNSDTNAATQSENSVTAIASNENSDGASTNTKQSKDINSNTPDQYLQSNTSFISIQATSIWYLGMLLSALWILYVNIRFQQSIKKDRTLLNDTACKLPVYLSKSIHSPMLLMVNGKFGIYITKACVDDKTKMRHALTHELCHYKHLDSLWSLVRCLILIIYWFNPFVWLAAILSKRDCELSCDAAALKILGDKERFTYGKTILEFVTVYNNRSSLLHFATGMSENKMGMKERIQHISKKSKMMLRTCITLFVIVVIAIIATFTTAPKKTNTLPDSKETDAITKEDSDTPKDTNIDTDIDLFKLLNEDNQTQGFDNGYYFNGEQYMTPDGPIESLSDFTDDMIINGFFGSCVWGSSNRVLDDWFSISFDKLLGVVNWITIDATEETSITIDYSTTATETTLKTLLILPDDTIITLKNPEINTITIPQGTSEIAIVAFDAAGEINIYFSDLTDAVSIKKN